MSAEQRRALANTTPTTDVIRDAVTFPRDRLGEPLDISAERFDAWLAAHNARVAREALDGLARDQEQKANRLFTRGGEPARRNRRMVVADEARRYRDTHYPDQEN